MRTEYNNVPTNNTSGGEDYVRGPDRTVQMRALADRRLERGIILLWCYCY